MTQVALLVGVALFVAQLVNFGLILNEREKASLAQNQGPAITRFASVAENITQTPPELRFAVLEDNSRRGARFSVNSESSVSTNAARNGTIEARARASLTDAGLNPAEVRATTTRSLRPDPRGPSREVQTLLLSAHLPPIGWVNGSLVTPRADPWLPARLALATLALFVIVLGATLIAINRVVRPLRDLTRAAETFGGRDAPIQVKSSGPADIRRAIDAFNAMNGRVGALLDEKDRMLGAIGHDLRTPLASLRIRAENVESDTERSKMVGTIEEMAGMLEDILVLARSGRAREEARPIDVTALADAVVEQFRELNLPVTFKEGARCVSSVQPILLRRALRNLIDNAVKYGGSAQVSVTSDRGQVRFDVSDQGPGLPTEELEHVAEPFYRVEGSRSRETGGIGLGLAISRAIAESHGGSLTLTNTHPGLKASIILPSD